MKDFIFAALPFVIIGICVAIICAKFKEEKKTYCSEGMALGMCFGVAIGTSFGNNTGIGLTLGMLAGLVIGSLIEKKDKDEEQ